jgi:hypothetical protein
MANIFVSASQARKDSRNNSVIHEEVRGLEAQVLAKIDIGELSVTVTSGTPMTDDVSYYNAYYGVTEDAAKYDQVTYVEQYFRNLGYNVLISENSITLSNIVWKISW